MNRIRKPVLMRVVGYVLVSLPVVAILGLMSASLIHALGIMTLLRVLGILAVIAACFIGGTALIDKAGRQ